ncbi:MAG: polysaccharide deacetylase family protein [Planctomycetales bacterium]|nr:polysaccharide deacetylase family protein [Planctomycetales bacterium]
MNHANPTNLTGALVVSLDFELHWGWRDSVRGDSPYMRNFHGARQAVPAMLELFSRFDIAATWATVGMLFAKNEQEVRAASPDKRPTYEDPSLDPYQEPLGCDESADPLHYAASLVREIQSCPRQELASHTFSHYYCLAAGQTREQFSADLASAVAIGHLRGAALRSIVFPRNQVNPRYEHLLLEHGFTCYRGNQAAWMYGGAGPASRAARLLDAHANLAGCHTQRWEEVVEPSGLANVRAGFFLRPCSNHASASARLQRRRIRLALTTAAQRGEILHLWWHPHNFGGNLQENLGSLTEILQHYEQLRESTGFESLSMGEVDQRAREHFGTRQSPAAA